MSMPAFYLAPENWNGHPWLGGEEAHHASVLRLGKNDKVLLMDGKGRSAICRIEKVERRGIALEPLEEWLTPMPESRAVMALALSKATRRGFFLEKAAELGAWEIWLWRAERSQGKTASGLAASCESQLRAGAKQCHNPWFPALRVLDNAASVAAAATEAQWRILPWEEKAGERPVSPEILARPGLTIFAIGPEGGLSPSEADLFLEAGFMPASLGSRVLRCETAAVLCLGLHWWASQRAPQTSV